MKRVLVDMPDSTHETLRQIAASRDSSMEQVILGHLVGLVQEFNRPTIRQIADLHAQGLSNAAIGRKMGMTNEQVRYRLGRMQLKSNTGMSRAHL